MTWARVKNRLLARVFTRFPGLAVRWAEGMTADGAPIPWSAPTVALADATVALVTTGGIHLATDEPFDMADPFGDPTLREIPADTPASALVTTHDYYDHTDADRDRNLVLPLERLRELVDRGVVGSIHPTAYALMGHIDGPHLSTLVHETAPTVARRVRDGGVDYAVLVPA